MRPTLSELGEYDGTALMEFKTKKDIIYRINRNTVCTYEMDDTPPFLMNDEALDNAIKMGLMFDCNISDEVHIIRKQYLDGSIPTGFQRTAIFALDGKVPYKGREIDIIQMSIEEDSCREISDVGHTRIYNTDRLGMPLIETVTGPNMRTPQEVADVAWICSNTVRSTGLVRRGLGAAREDVNVSVEGGTRIEIKGVPKITAIPLLTYNEAMRQWNLLRLRDELNKRGITEETFMAHSKDISKIMRKAYYLPIQEAVSRGDLIKCVVLKGFKDLLHWQTQTDTYFSREISDRVRVIACLTNIPNIIHSDSKGETLASAEWQKIKKYVDATDNDTMVLVWGDERDTETAVKEIIIRAKEATVGIPSETRQALRDGTNGFERILPGADRMYPDTDLPPIKITDEHVESLKEGLPEKFWKRQIWYNELGIPKDTITPLSVSEFAELFKSVVEEWKIDPVLAAVTLIQYPKRLRKRKLDISLITVKMMECIFKAYKDGLLSRDGILPILVKSVEKGKFYPELLPKPITKAELDEIVTKTKKIVDVEAIRYPEKKDEILMGKIMDRVRINISGKEVEQIIS